MRSVLFGCCSVFPSARLAIAVAVLTLFPLTAPSRAASDISQTRSVGGFYLVIFRGAFRGTITAGKKTTRVLVSGTPSVVSRVTTDVSGGTLIVKMKGKLGPSEPLPKVQIELPELHGYADEGASSVTIAGLTGGDIYFQTTDSSLVASGVADTEDVQLSGTGKIDTTGVDAREAAARNYGSGTVYVRANGSLRMDIDGAGDIRYTYTGNPSHLVTQMNGTGKISRLDLGRR
jgi:Putative auto-transporter adhesin, head GIN domain